MKNLFEPNTSKNILSRLDKLTINSERQWGTMTVTQMLTHCANAFKMATGKVKLKRPFLTRLIAPFFKSSYYNDKPFPKNIAMTKAVPKPDDRDFEEEKIQLKAIIQQFSEGGEAICTTHPHPFFGSFTPKQWSIGMYKHLDHHFRQFGC